MAAGAALETDACVGALTLQPAGLVFWAVGQLGSSAGKWPFTGDFGKMAGAALESEACVVAVTLQLAGLVFRAVDTSVSSTFDLMKRLDSLMKRLRNSDLGRILLELRRAEVFATLGVLQQAVPGPATSPSKHTLNGPTCEQALYSTRGSCKELEQPTEARAIPNRGATCHLLLLFRFALGCELAAGCFVKERVSKSMNTSCMC